MEKRTEYKKPKFYLDKRNNDKPAAIFLKYSYSPGERLSYFTGERIDPNNWDTTKQRIYKNVLGAMEVNDLLDSIFEIAQKTVRDKRLKKENLTVPEFKLILDAEVNTFKKNDSKQTKVKSDFFDAFDLFFVTESKNKSWTLRTNMKLQTLRKQLQQFEATKIEKDKNYRLSLRHVDETFFEQMITFWQDKCNHRNDTIQKNVYILKWFLNWAYKKKLLPSDSYKTVEVNLKTTERKVVFLTMEEIRKIKQMNIPDSKNYLQKTRDIFIFQCLTGLRFSDLRNLKATDRHNDYFEANTIKTGERVQIEFNETTNEIWQKYTEHQEATGKAFPVPANPVYNRFLKELAKMAELNETIQLVHYKGSERKEQTFFKWQLVCTHSARRSFITNGLDMKIASEVIRTWTGHKSDRSFKVYFDILKERKVADMSKFTL